MGRIRTIKPEIARHEVLYQAERESGLPLRFAWAVLPTACDREGRFKWRPRALKADILPYDEVDFERVLDTLQERGFIAKYRLDDEWYGCIPTFLRHQHINRKESASTLPSPEDSDEVWMRGSRVTVPGTCLHVLAPDGKGKGREGEKEGKKNICSEPLRVSEPALMLFPVVRSDVDWPLHQSQVDEWQQAFQTINVLAECRKALVWLKANDGRLKTYGGMPRFFVNWFTRATNSGASRYTPAVQQAVPQRRQAWICPHVEECAHRAMCEVKNLNPTKYPVKAGAVAS